MKNKLSIILLAFCFVFYLTTTAQTSKWIVGLRFTPEYSYRSLILDHDVYYASFLANIKNKDEVPQWGCTSGIIAQYNFHKSLSAEMNILFVNRGYTDKLLSYGGEINSRSGFISSDEVYVKFKYIQMPLLLSYQIGSSKLHMNLAVGIVSGILVQYKKVWHYPNGEESNDIQRNNPNINKFSLGTMAKVAVAYNLKDHWQISLAPTAYYSIAPTVVAPVSERLYSFGIETGLSYRF
jgi:hypothetical protein